MVAKKKSESAAMDGDVAMVEDFSGDLNSLENGQVAYRQDIRVWYLKSPNGILMEVHDGHVIRQSDGTISVRNALSAEMQGESPEERIMWTGIIDHGKWVPNE